MIGNCNQFLRFNFSTTLTCRKIISVASSTNNIKKVIWNAIFCKWCHLNIMHPQLVIFESMLRWQYINFPIISKLYCDLNSKFEERFLVMILSYLEITTEEVMLQNNYSHKRGLITNRIFCWIVFLLSDLVLIF